MRSPFFSIFLGAIKYSRHRRVLSNPYPMKQTAYGQPLLLKQSEEGTQIVPLMQIVPPNEIMIQDLVFSNPECLPISEIDEAYNPLVPVCKELNTAVGPLDVLMISPNGELCIVEAKLWRNPDSRRKVVAQILDYAKELASWSYEDLQREINRRLNEKGNTLYRTVRKASKGYVLPESGFVDAVSRNLASGKFLLLIVGDGIREGMAGIRDFIVGAGNLVFTLSMVELSLYKNDSLGILVVPKILMKTVELPRLIVEVPKGMRLVVEREGPESPVSKSLSPEQENEKRFYAEFWEEFVKDLEFDDPGQPIPDPAKAQNLYVYPAGTKRVWISAYFSKSRKRVGVYFRTQDDHEGHQVMRYLAGYQDRIEGELGPSAILEWNETGGIGVRMDCENVFDDKYREGIKMFFHNWLNQFVNTFRPLLKKMEKE